MAAVYWKTLRPSCNEQAVGLLLYIVEIWTMKIRTQFTWGNSKVQQEWHSAWIQSTAYTSPHWVLCTEWRLPCQTHWANQSMCNGLLAGRERRVDALPKTIWQHHATPVIYEEQIPSVQRAVSNVRHWRVKSPWRIVHCWACIPPWRAAPGDCCLGLVLFSVPTAEVGFGERVCTDSLKYGCEL